MLRDLIICCDGGAVPLPLDTETLVREARARWGAQATHLPGVTERVELRLDIAADGPGYYITVLRSFDSINLDGTYEQNVETAVWLRSLMPSDAPAVVAFDSGYTAKVPLRPGMTADEFNGEVRRALLA
ncbi:hypothetical protein [Cellulomonas endometrii]|uniref:hypothetical protein n=1 Tax=Cellulomonas endometrii TaxID=3036301 RepID=UPI0024AD4473|nr:hypothetical protein [Cellulomonas endometrii]